MNPDTHPLRFDAYDPRDERRRESLLGLGNGVLFVRAGVPEQRLARTSAYPTNYPPDEAHAHYPGIYRAGLYNPVTACANGETLRAAFLPRLPDATVLAVRRGGEPWLGTHTAQLVRYTHALDMETAQATRTLLLRIADSTTRIVESRFVSAAHPSVFVIRWHVTACDWSGPLDIADGTDGDVRNAIVERQRAFDGRHIVDVMHAIQPDGVLLTSARLSGAQVSIAIGSRVDVQCASEETGPRVEWKEGAACFTRRTVHLRAGETVCIDKIVSVHTSRDALRAIWLCLSSKMA